MRNNLLEEIRKVHPEAVIDRTIDDAMNEIKEKVIKMEPNFGNYDCQGNKTMEEIPEKLSLDELNQLIGITEKRLRKLKSMKFELVNARNLFEEGREFRKRVYEAADQLRRTDPVAFTRKCKEATWTASNSWYVGVNNVSIGQKWEMEKAKICSWASHGRARSVTKLTDEEYQMAKIFALSVIRDNEKYWKE